MQEAAAGESPSETLRDVFIGAGIGCHLESHPPAPRTGSVFSLSKALGSDMVLQRDAPAVVWGTAPPGAVVETTFAGKNYTSTADSTGAWKQALPPTPAGGPYTIAFTSQSASGPLVLERVLFGDVYFCSGQSNMVFTVPQLRNSSDEASRAALYPLVRLFTVAPTVMSTTPLDDIPDVAQNWTAASPVAVAAGNWTEFSAACWLAGRNVADALGGTVPIGLITSAWGGTRIRAWVDASGCESCGEPVPTEDPPSPHFGNSSNATVLYNSMVNPFLPMRLKGVWWWQGEQDWMTPPAHYTCLFRALITSWRALFVDPTLFFAFVILQPPYTTQMRDMQLAVSGLPYVGYASAEDIGEMNSPFGEYHPTRKQLPGARLAAAALNITYGLPVAWTAPNATVAVALPRAGGAPLAVRVAFSGVGSDGLIVNEPAPSTSCQVEFGVAPSACGWPTIVGSDGSSYNASLTVDATGEAVIFSAPTAPQGVTAAGVQYGLNDWPAISIFRAAPIITRWESVYVPAAHFNLTI
jgi:sialate O-acetylesterase